MTHNFSAILIFFLLLCSAHILSGQEKAEKTTAQKETDKIYYDAKEIYDEGDYAHALTQFLKSLNMCRVAYPKTSDRRYKIHFRLGNTYTRLTQYDQAIMHWDSAIALSIKLYGELHEETIWNYIDQGNTYSLKFDLAKSNELNQKALQLTEELYGPRANYS